MAGMNPDNLIRSEQTDHAPRPALYVSPRLGDMLELLEQFDRPVPEGSDGPQSPSEYVQNLTLQQARVMLDDAEFAATQLRTLLDRLAQMREVVQSQAGKLSAYLPGADPEDKTVKSIAEAQQQMRAARLRG